MNTGEINVKSATTDHGDQLETIVLLSSNSYCQHVYLGKFTSMCDAGCLWKPTRFHITNDLGPGLDLAIHCKSRNDDLGQHLVPFGGEYKIDFCPNFWGTTLFFCGMSWSREAHWFDNYDASRDSSRCEQPAAASVQPFKDPWLTVSSFSLSQSLMPLQRTEESCDELMVLREHIECNRLKSTWKKTWQYNKIE
ncbi:hypothetical protein SADUNF_Sadunf18G0112800 [Salix dunnii]|uniref:S-protein homolog n=1 Tax=Salix dunnii TaxID=1413687 RepID=A0A835J4A5_9ROSI|nr:hypothetical protein SADUNF_Sadunf18G0112800 [Salix dunnii]